VLFETGSEELRALEQKVYVACGRFIIETGKPTVVEYLGSSYFLTKLLYFSMGAPKIGAVSRAYNWIAFVLVSQLLKQLPAPELPPKKTTF